jgi:hypothetical protein
MARARIALGPAAEPFGRSRVVGRPTIDRGGDARWLVLCACGTVARVRATRLVSGEAHSCGCWKRSRTRPEAPQSPWAADRRTGGRRHRAERALALGAVANGPDRLALPVCVVAGASWCRRCTSRESAIHSGTIALVRHWAGCTELHVPIALLMNCRLPWQRRRAAIHHDYHH